MLIIFDDIIADMLSNKKLSPIVTDLFIREKNINISLVFVTQSYFAVSKNIRINSTQDFMILYKICTPKPYYFLVIDTTLASDNSSRFRKNLLERI